MRSTILHLGEGIYPSASLQCQAFTHLITGSEFPSTPLLTYKENWEEHVLIQPDKRVL